VHLRQVARQVIKEYAPAAGMWPSDHIPSRLEAAREKLGLD
jgi:acyl-CoA dehydrogenase